MKFWTKKNIKFINACRDILELTLPEAKEVLEYALYKKKNRNAWLKNLPLKNAIPITECRKILANVNPKLVEEVLNDRC